MENTLTDLADSYSQAVEMYDEIIGRYRKKRALAMKKRDFSERCECEEKIVRYQRIRNELTYMSARMKHYYDHSSQKGRNKNAT